MNLETNKSLARYSTFMVGGPADYFISATSQEEIIEAIKFAHQKAIPFILIGGGSNIIFDDLGFRGLVILNQSQDFSVSNDSITADSGMRVSKLIKIAQEHNLNGLEPWVGLPGTFGGAIRGNAGCHGLETKDILTSATLLDPKTLQVIKITPQELQYSYRESSIKHSDHLVLDGTIKLQKNALSKEETQALIKENSLKRITTQPRGLTCGSFFKNPPDNSAGRLIQEAGLKGFILDKAQISDKHANFFLNLGGATADNIKTLARTARQKVQASSGITLLEEVQIYDQHGKTKL
ncbi:UDP-N-acetylenolpyruvoylglucosamine reductase [Candidatus Peregrinibacteria bacterium HGW-Peregrinibacteria-1]|nr:MAG: UDP-N-acetylenolpyruvoylglucosamine reductase [Candidatus Peregrinibacteria bacterium HGW-Peregrinibacteria-1]